MDLGFSVLDKFHLAKILQITCKLEFTALLSHLKNKLEDQMSINKNLNNIYYV